VGHEANDRRTGSGGISTSEEELKVDDWRFLGEDLSGQAEGRDSWDIGDERDGGAGTRSKGKKSHLGGP